MLSVSFTRAPINYTGERFANYEPMLVGYFEKDGRFNIGIHGQEDYGLRKDGPHEDSHLMAIPFEGQRTYDELRARYLNAVGVVFAHAYLKHKPTIALEQTSEGWYIATLGDVELPYTYELVEQLGAMGFSPYCSRRQTGEPVIIIQIPLGSELEMFERLMPLV